MPQGTSQVRGDPNIHRLISLTDEAIRACRWVEEASRLSRENPLSRDRGKEPQEVPGWLCHQLKEEHEGVHKLYYFILIEKGLKLRKRREQNLGDVTHWRGQRKFPGWDGFLPFHKRENWGRIFCTLKKISGKNKLQIFRILEMILLSDFEIK